MTGTTYNPDQGEVLGLPSGGLDAALAAVAEVCAVCSEAGIESKGGVFKAVGAPTEAALKVSRLGPWVQVGVVLGWLSYSPRHMTHLTTRLNE